MMRTKYFCLGMVLAWLGLGGVGWTATIVAGDVTAQWSGTGKLFEMKNQRKFFNGEASAVLKEHVPVDRQPSAFHMAQIRCHVSMNVQAGSKTRESFGTCSITIPDQPEVAHARWKCSSQGEACNGEFTWMWGTGRFEGISGSTKFSSRLIIGVTKEGGIHGKVVWPSMSYELP